ncbi:MAG: hypothetical protein K2H48_05860 [Duncaniella sp.]|nr:hypothetical protein [Duncaniella sp.]
MDSKKLNGNALHIVSPEKAVNYKWEEYADKLPAGVQIISIDEINNLPVEIRKQYFGLQNIELNDVFLFEPYSKRYILSSNAEDSFFERKFYKIAEIARLLGASSISHEVTLVEVMQRVLSATGDITYKAVEVSAEVKRDYEEKIRNTYKLHEDFTSPKLTLEGYNRAKEICIETSLIQVPVFEHLLAMRDPSHPSSLKYYEKNINLAQDINEGLEVAFKLNILKGVFSLNANTTETLSKSKNLNSKMIIEF